MKHYLVPWNVTGYILVKFTFLKPKSTWPLADLAFVGILGQDLSLQSRLLFTYNMLISILTLHNINEFPMQLGEITSLNHYLGPHRENQFFTCQDERYET